MKTTVTELPGLARADRGRRPGGRGRPAACNAPPATWPARCGCPGFRKGKVPPQLVIQRLGRDAVSSRRFASAPPRVVRAGAARLRRRPGRRPELDVVIAARGRGRAARASRFEIGVRPAAKLGDYKGLEVGQGRARGRRRGVEASSSALREGFATLEPVERAAATGDVALIDFEGPSTASPSRAARADDYLVELGAGSLVEGSRSAHRRRGRRGARPSRSPSPTTTGPSSSPARRRASRSTVKEVREKEPARARRRLRHRGLRVRHARRAARRHPRAARARRSSAAHEEEFREAPRSTPRSTRRPSTCPTSSSTPAPRSSGSGSSASSRRAAWTPRHTCRCRARPARS